MKILFMSVILTLTWIAASGCSWYSKRWGADAKIEQVLAEEREVLFKDVVLENEKMMRDFHRDAIKFYEETADAYFIIGYEYYKMARDMEAKEDAEGAQQYAIRAKLYHEFSNDLQSAADRRQKQLDELEDKLAADQAPPLESMDGQALPPMDAAPVPPPLPPRSAPASFAPPANAGSASLVGEGDLDMNYIPMPATEPPPSLQLQFQPTAGSH